MRAALRWSISVVVLATLLAPAAATAQQIPSVPPPTLISPVIETGVPILFQWTPVNPGNLYTFSLQNRARQPVAINGPIVVSYELQISDRPDVNSRVLFDLTTSVAIYVFQNQNIAGSGFTSQQQPGVPLSGGNYYWRVRALLNETPMPFSQIGRFALSLGNGGGASTPIHDMQITSIVLTAVPYVNSTTAIVASVQNTGTFPENLVPFTMTVNGVVVARGQIPPTTAGQTQRLSALWTPATVGEAQVSALIDFPGPINRGKIATISPYVSEPPTVQTALHGTVALTERGYVLNDPNGRELALIVLLPDARIDVGAFLGRNVLVHGSVTKSGALLIINARTIALAAGEH